MIIFLFWVGFAIIVGVAANTRGRDSVGWGVLAVFISPLLAGLLLLALPRGTKPRSHLQELQSDLGKLRSDLGNLHLTKGNKPFLWV
jgi:hypothetical protein